MKAVCTIVNDGVVINGDVVFCKLQNVYAWSMDGRSNIKIENSFFCNHYSKKMPIKLKSLWFWHMVLLRKSHVYLTGALK